MSDDPAAADTRALPWPVFAQVIALLTSGGALGGAGALVGQSADAVTHHQVAELTTTVGRLDASVRRMELELAKNGRFTADDAKDLDKRITAIELMLEIRR